MSRKLSLFVKERLCLKCTEENLQRPSMKPKEWTWRWKEEVKDEGLKVINSLREEMKPRANETKPTWVRPAKPHLEDRQLPLGFSWMTQPLLVLKKAYPTSLGWLGHCSVQSKRTTLGIYIFRSHIAKRYWVSVSEFFTTYYPSPWGFDSRLCIRALTSSLCLCLKN